MTQMTSQFRVVTQDAIKPNMGVQQVALFDASGNPLIVVQTAAVMPLTGYTAGSSTAALAATDTVNAALAKLANRIDALTTLTTALDTRVTALEGA